MNGRLDRRLPKWTEMMKVWRISDAKSFINHEPQFLAMEKVFFSFSYQDNSISRLSCFYENTEKWKLLLRERKKYETGEGIVFVQWKAIHTKWIKYYRRNEVHWRAAIQASGNGTLEPTINSMIDTRPGIWRWFLW